MKELTIEQKAKRYDEAIEKARVWKEKSRMPKDKQGILNNIFPELKESGDERIKNDVKRAISVALDYSYFDKETTNNCLDWLEKQGEQREQLINKACNILVNCIEDYMLRRMEVWSEECKNQTLENIRKKLEE